MAMEPTTLEPTLTTSWSPHPEPLPHLEALPIIPGGLFREAAHFTASLGSGREIGGPLVFKSATSFSGPVDEVQGFSMGRPKISDSKAPVFRREPFCCGDGVEFGRAASSVRLYTSYSNCAHGQGHLVLVSRFFNGLFHTDQFARPFKVIECEDPIQCPRYL